jgi:hypothetical protein
MTEHDDIASAMETRRRFARRLRGGESPEERLARFVELQRASFALLQASPDGLASFLRRNFRSRRAEVIDGEWRPVSPERRVE